MKSTMIPTADPRPNYRTATTLLVASEAMPKAVVPLAPRAARPDGHRRHERLLRRSVAPGFVPVLHDVHVVGDREDDDQRDEHAR